METNRKSILRNLETECFGVESLADAVFISRSQLFRKIKSLTGRSVARYIHQVRVEEVKRLLASTGLNAIDIDANQQSPVSTDKVTTLNLLTYLPST